MSWDLRRIYFSALFYINTTDKIVSNANLNGSSPFTNADKPKHNGIEYSLDSKFDPNISTYFTDTLLNAKFDSAFNSMSAPIESENRMRGIYRNQFYG